MSHRRLWILAAVAAARILYAATAESSSGTEEIRRHHRFLESIPARPAGAVTGGEFARRTTHMPGRQRQAQAVAELLAGNLPSFLRRLEPVTLEAKLEDGGHREIVLWVMPDYLAIGDDRDYLRMPLTWPSATTVARAFDCVLPTPRIVDAIWHQADRHLTPAPLTPGPRMRSSEYYLQHRGLIEAERGDLSHEALVAGHKKDVVLTERLNRRPGRIAIYGWHRKSGAPIQPLSTVHEARYADYSHGIRLVWEEALVDGRWMSIYEILADPKLSALLSAEGPIPNARTLMGLESGTSSR